MSDLTDLEKTLLCAAALKLDAPSVDGETGKLLIRSFPYTSGRAEFDVYDPLNDSAQAEALDEVILKADRTICIYPDEFLTFSFYGSRFSYVADMTLSENRRRARVECVAKMMKEKT